MNPITDPQLYTAVGRLEGKIDALLSNQNRFDKRLDEQDARIAALEQLRDKGSGVWSSLSWAWVCASAAIALFATDIKDFFLK